MNDVLAIILGGGRGQRLFPLTHQRSKPAVPIAGKYRLIDIPISNCLHSDVRRIFVLTQFNSASLNRHIAQTYRMDMFSRGFVEILAAEQTPEGEHWFQGTADAVRQARAALQRPRGGLLPDSRGRSHVPDGLRRDDRDAHRSECRHHHRRAAGRSEDATGMGIFHFDRSGQIVAFEEKPNAERLSEIGPSVPTGAGRHDCTTPTSRSWPRWASTSSRATCCSTCCTEPRRRLRPRDHPAALGALTVQPHLYRGFWADVGTVSRSTT